MPKIIILIGLPASGKSTWRNNYIVKNSNTIVISNDDCLEKIGKEKRLTYNQSIHDNDIQEYCKKYRNDLMKYGFDNDIDIIVDMTNMSKKSRNRSKGNVPKSYQIDYVLFDIPRCIINHNNFERYISTGKYISDYVYSIMENNFEWPDEKEYDSLEIIKE